MNDTEKVLWPESCRWEPPTCQPLEDLSAIFLADLSAWRTRVKFRYETTLLKQCINKRGYRTAFHKNNQCADESQDYQYGQQPIAFSNFQKFPKFPDNRLIGHLSPFKIASKTFLVAVPARSGLPSMKIHPCRVSAAGEAHQKFFLSKLTVWLQHNKQLSELSLWWLFQ